MIYSVCFLPYIITVHILVDSNDVLKYLTEKRFHAVALLFASCDNTVTYSEMKEKERESVAFLWNISCVCLRLSFFKPFI